MYFLLLEQQELKRLVKQEHRKFESTFDSRSANDLKLNEKRQRF